MHEEPKEALIAIAMIFIVFMFGIGGYYFGEFTIKKEAIAAGCAKYEVDLKTGVNKLVWLKNGNPIPKPVKPIEKTQLDLLFEAAERNGYRITNIEGLGE